MSFTPDVRLSVDLVRPGRGLVTFHSHDLGGGIVTDDGEWIAEDADGMVVGPRRKRKEAAVRDLVTHYGLSGIVLIRFEKEFGDQRKWDTSITVSGR